VQTFEITRVEARFSKLLRHRKEPEEESPLRHHASEKNRRLQQAAGFACLVSVSLSVLQLLRVLLTIDYS
jgi:hypothetical protein